MAALPTKLKKDSIIEAIFDVRFTCDDVPELVIGKLAGNPTWNAFPAQQLPTANIPAAMRRMDANMQYLPVLERRSTDNKQIIRIGDRAISFHRAKPYPDWPIFGPELHDMMKFLLDRAQLANLGVARFGLRYVNAFTEKDHGVKAIADLNLRISIGNKPLELPINLNFRRDYPDNKQAVVRITSRELVQAADPPDLCALVDIDVATPSGFKSDGRDAHDWIEAAHEVEKTEYFGLYTDEMKDRLIERL
jgi:uncharacterized protein (TIGR04255 family)